MKHAFDRFVQYLQKNYFSYWIVLGIDTFIALICTWVSFIGIHYITETSKEITSVISSVLGSFLFHTYRNTIRFSQLKELWRLAGSALIKAVCIAMAIWLFLPQTGLHNSQKIVFVLFDGMLTFIVMVGFRIQLILVYEFLLNLLNKKNMHILIYGIDDKSVALKVRLMNSSDAWLIFPFIHLRMKSALTSLFIRSVSAASCLPVTRIPVKRKTACFSIVKEAG